jgi:hypothetical protein
MFAPPILPLSSIMSHPSAQSSPFGPSSDSIFPGTNPYVSLGFLIYWRKVRSEREKPLQKGPLAVLCSPASLPKQQGSAPLTYYKLVPYDIA